MNNLLIYCGLVDAKIRATDKDLPVKKYQRRLKDFPKLWKPVIDKTPVEKVKQIAIAVSQFFQVNHLYSNANNNGLRGRVVRDLIEAKAAENQHKKRHQGFVISCQISVNLIQKNI